MATIAEPRSLQLDPGRITAGAGAIALNAALLMLLLVPIAAPPMLERVSRDAPEIIWIKRDPPKPPEPPETVEVRNPTPTLPTPAPTIRNTPRPPLEATTDDPQPGDVVVPPGDTTAIHVEDGSVLPPDDGKPMQGAHLEYAAAPPPTYPREALLDNLTGVVMLQVLVDVDGRPLEVTVQRSSGHRVLDAAARRQVLSKWRFRPAMRNGVAVQAIGIVPVEFKLD